MRKRKSCNIFYISRRKGIFVGEIFSSSVYQKDHLCTTWWMGGLKWWTGSCYRGIISHSITWCRYLHLSRFYGRNRRKRWKKQKVFLEVLKDAKCCLEWWCARSCYRSIISHSINTCSLSLRDLEVKVEIKIPYIRWRQMARGQLEAILWKMFYFLKRFFSN